MTIAPSTMAVARRLVNCTGGATAVEAAFILPILLMSLLGVLEMGRLGWTQSALNFAVLEAARCASLNSTACGNANATKLFAAKKATGTNVPASAFAVTTEPCGRQVRARFEYRLILYPIFRTNPTLTAQACRA
jgi:Flp pilus assembly protein TadG